MYSNGMYSNGGWVGKPCSGCSGNLRSILYHQEKARTCLVTQEMVVFEDGDEEEEFEGREIWMMFPEIVFLREQY